MTYTVIYEVHAFGNVGNLTSVSHRHDKNYL